MRQLVFLINIFIIWFVLSGNTDNFFLISGLISSVITIVFFYKLNLNSIINFKTYKLFHAIRYFFWLQREIFNSAQKVIKIIWQTPINISPTYNIIETELTDNLDKALYANSITLTPGTLTMGINGQQLLVHSITKEGFDELTKGSMEKRIKELRGIKTVGGLEIYD